MEAAKKKGKLFQFILGLQNAMIKTARDLEIEKTANEIAIKDDINLKEAFLPPWDAPFFIRYSFDEYMKISKNSAEQQIRDLEKFSKAQKNTTHSEKIRKTRARLNREIDGYDRYFSLSVSERIKYQKARLRKKIISYKRILVNLQKESENMYVKHRISATKRHIQEREKELLLLTKP